jgi:uncharacterized OB-fold protein
MSALSICPDYSSLEVPSDSWSAPFWKAAAEGKLLMPRCTKCGTFRWPAGPFCHECHSQPVEWVPPGRGRIYSFTILPVPGPDKEAPPQIRIPALVEFDDAPGVRLVSVLVDASPKDVAISAPVEIEWRPAANATVPIFKLSGGLG